MALTLRHPHPPDAHPHLLMHKDPPRYPEWTAGWRLWAALWAFGTLVVAMVCGAALLLV